MLDSKEVAAYTARLSTLVRSHALRTAKRHALLRNRSASIVFARFLPIRTVVQQWHRSCKLSLRDMPYRSLGRVGRERVFP